MSVQYLDPERPAVVAAGQVEIELVDRSGAGAEVDLVDADTGQRVHFHRLSHTALVMGPLESPATLLVRAAGDGRFPDGARVQVVVRVGHAPDQSQLVLGATDVGALHAPELIALRPEGALLSVLALPLDQAARSDLGDDRGAPLEGLAGDALYTSRELRQEYNAPSLTRGLGLCLDTSASMVVHRRSGLLQGLVQVVLGVDRGMGDGGDVPVWGVGDGVTDLPPITPQNVGDYVAEVLNNQPLATGCRADLLTRSGHVDAGGRTVLVVTDQVPPAIEEAAREWSEYDGDWRLVVIGSEEELVAAGEVPGLDSCAVAPDIDEDGLSGSSGERQRRELIIRLMGISRVGGSR